MGNRRSKRNDPPVENVERDRRLDWREASPFGAYTPTVAEWVARGEHHRHGRRGQLRALAALYLHTQCGWPLDLIAEALEIRSKGNISRMIDRAREQLAENLGNGVDNPPGCR